MKDIELSEESKQRILEAQKRDALRNELNKNNYSNNYQKTSVSKQRPHKEKKKSAIRGGDVRKHLCERIGVV